MTEGATPRMLSRNIAHIIMSCPVLFTQQPDLEALLSGMPDAFAKVVVPWMGLHRYACLFVHPFNCLHVYKFIRLFLCIHVDSVNLLDI